VTSDLLRLLDEQVPGAEFVRGVAGDRPLTMEEKREFEERRQRRGEAFYSDLLMALSHRYFPPEAARETWQQIIRHRNDLTGRLGRNPGVAVAALDYLSNIDGSIKSPVIMPYERVATVAEVALRDELTGLFDRQAFMHKLRQELRRHHRCWSPFSIMMMDIDDFKKVNDIYGHQRGDQVLADVGRIISDSVRDTDIPARYGGEEFAILLPGTGYWPALQKAERVRKAVEEQSARNHGVTLSVGVACCPEHGRGLWRLIQHADEALYASKRAGKNRVTGAADGIAGGLERRGPGSPGPGES